MPYGSLACDARRCARARWRSPAPPRAQDAYPTRPVRLVVGFGAGGPTDIPARFIADKLGTLLGQRVIVENKPGAAGMLATRDVLAQPARRLQAAALHAFRIDQHRALQEPGFKLADLAPISLIAKYYYGIALANAVPADDFEQLRAIRQGPSRRGQLRARIGAGSAQEILARQLEKLAGISMNRIPFRTGPQVMPDLIAGRVHFYVSPTLGVAAAAPEQAAQDPGDHQPRAARERCPTFRR